MLGVSVWADDQNAESALVLAVAATCDDIEEHHVTNTSCAQLSDEARRLKSTVAVLDLTGRKLSSSNSSSSEIDLAILAPGETAAALGESLVSALDTSLNNGTLFALLLSLASALNTTVFDDVSILDAYLPRTKRDMLGFLDPAIVVILASSVTAGSVAAISASSAVPAGDPLSLVFAVQFVSLTSSIDGLPAAYSDDYAGSFGWYVLRCCA